MSQQKETERVREIFDASAAQYDKGPCEERICIIHTAPSCPLGANVITRRVSWLSGSITCGLSV